jgi:hypothetical protein
MKKIILIILLFIGFTAFNISQASAQCYIEYVAYGSGGGQITNETARTPQAAQEFYDLLSVYYWCDFGSGETPSFNTDNCFGYDTYPIIPNDSECMSGECWQWVCLDGGWSTGSMCHDPQTYEYNMSDSGTWDVVCYNTTTTTTPASLIKLSSFTATPKFSKVIIQWSTEAEIENVGFNLYRSETEDGEYIKINDSLIPAQGSSTQGASYEFVDTGLKNRKTYYYKLEDIDLNGNSTFHGSVSATPRLIFSLFGIFNK